MQLGHYLDLLHRAESDLAAALRTVAHAHGDETDVASIGQRCADQCDQHVADLKPFAATYATEDPPDNLLADRFSGPRTGPLGLLRDLHDLYVMAAECDICWTLVGQSAQGVRDRELTAVVQRCERETSLHLSWLRSRLKAAAPQALLVAT